MAERLANLSTGFTLAFQPLSPLAHQCCPHRWSAAGRPGGSARALTRNGASQKESAHLSQALIDPHHLYDIDLVINRTLVYGSLTVVIAGMFQAVDVAVHHLFLVVTEQESWLGVIVSALAIVALFEPLKRRIKYFVDHCIFRKEGKSN
jgi:hypothetical protein